ncbi:hypothetical protein ACP275_14G220100 [Erythranthe tilingii]
MSCQRIRLILIAFMIFLIMKRLLALDNFYGCRYDYGNYTVDDGRYSVDLDKVLSLMPKNVDINGFYNASVGDIAYAMVLCRGDAGVEKCGACIKDVTQELRRNCTNQSAAVAWSDLCMVRYSNTTLYRKFDNAIGNIWQDIGVNVTSPIMYKADLQKLLENLTIKASSGGYLRKIAYGNATGPDLQTIYALVQCTPDLSTDDCNSCLTQIEPYLVEWVTRGRVAWPSCTIFYDTNNRFYNETRLQELDQLVHESPSLMLPHSPILPPPGRKNIDGNSSTRIVIIIIIIAVSVIAFAILAATAVILLRRRMKQKEKLDNEITTAESLQYAFSTISAATNDFSDNNKLGQGGFGAVYMGNLPNNREIAVKRLSKNSRQGDLEFKNEVVLLAKLQHRNLVKLLGFSIRGTEKLIIYEFVPNTSLDRFIFDPIRSSSLDWYIRKKIIGGIAKGILYLHEDSQIRIIHRDLKASNILLDGEMNPKIADFGMARLFGHDETQGNTSKIVGTYGYMSPEYAMHGQFSVRSDVFSFGVLVLEIICGRRSNCIKDGAYVDLLSFAWKNWCRGSAENIIDPVLRGAASACTSSLEDILRCIQIGLLCVEENAANRPTMASILLMLSGPTINLPTPSDPALFMANRFGPKTPLTPEYDSNANKLYSSSAGLSTNDVTVTDLYPR